MGNQVMRCVDVAHKKGPLSRGLSVWWCLLSSALSSFAGFERRPKGMGRGGCSWTSAEGLSGLKQELLGVWLWAFVHSHHCV